MSVPQIVPTIKIITSTASSVRISIDKFIEAQREMEAEASSLLQKKS